MVLLYGQRSNDNSAESIKATFSIKHEEVEINNSKSNEASAVIAPMSEAFVRAIEGFAKAQQLNVVAFKKDQRKDDVAKAYLARCTFTEGVLFIGKAQEKAPVFRTTHKKNAETGKSFPWILARRQFFK